MTHTHSVPEDKASGCLMGLMCGDALGAPVEFHTPEGLQKRYPGGITDMVEGWGCTISRARGFSAKEARAPGAVADIPAH